MIKHALKSWRIRTAAIGVVTGASVLAFSLSTADAAVSPGLKATYYNTSTFAGTSFSRVDSTINKNWGTGSPNSKIHGDTFSARWTGSLTAASTGTYRLATVADDGSRLWINGKLIINDWNKGGPNTKQGTVALKAGVPVSIKLEYFEWTGPASIKLQWAKPGRNLSVIPKSALSTKTTPLPVPTGAKVLFEDNFDGPKGSLPNPNKWGDMGPCVDGPHAAYGLTKCGATEYLDGQGHMVVPATPTAGSGIQTRGKFGMTEGVVSAWIKTPKEIGYWPAFWMVNDPLDGSKVNVVGEIDIMEHWTKWRTESRATFHAWNTSGNGSGEHWGAPNWLCEPSPGPDRSAGFHKYTAKIEPTRISFYVDDVRCGNFVNKPADKPWPFAPENPHPYFLRLNNAIGDAGGQQPAPTKPDVMVVDRVLVTTLN